MTSENPAGAECTGTGSRVAEEDTTECGFCDDGVYHLRYRDGDNDDRDVRCPYCRQDDDE